jgi:hypothetical protein
MSRPHDLPDWLTAAYGTSNEIVLAYDQGDP